MKMSMRWYGPDDPVTLSNIRQIPGMKGIVSALHEVPTGQTWGLGALKDRQNEIENVGLEFAVIESIPVAEAIKLGLPERDALIEQYCDSVRNAGAAGIPVVCYNFMPVFDWMRTDLAMAMPDGSTALSFSQDDLAPVDLTAGVDGLPDMRWLPGWSDTYTREALYELLRSYQDVDERQMLHNLIYFLEAVVPVAEESGVFMAVHPDDPPWSIFGLPRVVTNAQNLASIFDAVDSLHNGLTFCTGSLGASPENDLPAMIRRFGDRIHFVHARNVKITGDRTFHESEHPSEFGSVDMFEVIKTLVEIGYTGPIRPDHGRMIWGESGRPGYGLFDRALGAAYLNGLSESIRRTGS